MEVRDQNAQNGGCVDLEQKIGDYEISSNNLKNDVSYLPESSQDVSVGWSSRHTYSTVWDKLAVDYDNITYSLRGGKNI